MLTDHRPRRAGFRPALAGLVAALTFPTVAPTTAGAGDLFRRPRPAPSRARAPVAAARVVPDQGRFAVNNYGRLGSYYPTPYLMVRGNAPAGGGYSPLGTFGETTMSLYGPLSGFRMTTAPVLTYSRGYDGRTVVTQGTSFSAPNLPALTPVVYPTQATYAYGFRHSGSPPWWANAYTWIDQN
jgi:hypothetical protein